MMRTTLCLLLLAACELEPAPKTKPAAAGSAAPAQPVPAPTPPPAPTPSPAPPAPVVDACTDAAVKYVEIGIAEAKDAQLKQNLEIERARTVLRIEQGCRAQKWSTEVTDCYKAAKTQADLMVCTKKLQPVPAAGPGAVQKQDQPTVSPDKKPEDKKPIDKKPADKKPVEKKPADKKPAPAKKQI